MGCGKYATHDFNFRDEVVSWSSSGDKNHSMFFFFKKDVLERSMRLRLTDKKHD